MRLGHLGSHESVREPKFTHFSRPRIPIQSRWDALKIATNSENGYQSWVQARGEIPVKSGSEHLPDELDESAKMTAGIERRLQRRVVTIAPSVSYRLSHGLLLLLTFLFALQVFSPLRLNTDAVVLLSMGDSAAHGGGFYSEKVVFPAGYPALLAALMKVGLGHPWAIVGTNLVFLSLGLFATYSLLIHEFFENKTVVLIICSFFLLSFVVVKHFPIPLTDVPFFCCSMCCLAVMSKATKTESIWRFLILAVAAWSLALVAITVRSVGVALVPPFLFMIVCSPHFKLLLKHLSRRTKLMILVVSVLLGVATLYVVAKTSPQRYLLDFMSGVKGSSVPTLGLQILSYQLSELGELLVNIPMSKVPIELHFMMPWIGLPLFLLTLFGVATKRREIGPTEVYLICYIAILFAWPYYDARLWLPVIPLLIAYSLLAVKRLELPNSVVAIYCIAFGTLGLIAIAYSTRISFSGSTFPDKYGDGQLRPTYCAAFQSCERNWDSGKVDNRVLRLLRDYD
jgi:hypothetical protein